MSNGPVRMRAVSLWFMGSPPEGVGTDVTSRGSSYGPSERTPPYRERGTLPIVCDISTRRILHLGRANGMDVRIEEIDHTADVGIRVLGSSPEELFEGAALGMFSLITDLSRVKPVGEIEVRVSADDLPALLVAWLSELLVLHETQNILLGKFEIHLDGLTLDGKAWGERIDKDRHELKLGIKAVTYHRLFVDPKRGMAEVIFDA